MEDQLIHCLVQAETGLQPEPLKPVDDEDPALAAMVFASWLAPNFWRELSIVVLPDNNSRCSQVEHAGAALVALTVNPHVAKNGQFPCGYNWGVERSWSVRRPVGERRLD